MPIAGELATQLTTEWDQAMTPMDLGEEEEALSGGWVALEAKEEVAQHPHLWEEDEEGKRPPVRRGQTNAKL